MGQIRVSLNNGDLGRESYGKRLSSNNGIRLIDYDHPENNRWVCAIEMPCINGNEEFRPDIALMVNGLTLVFIEVKKPNNNGMINNEPYFDDQVKHCIALVLNRLHVPAKPDDRRYLTSLIAAEYEREYNGWR